MSVLNEDLIKERMSSMNYKDKLIVTPLLDEKQIGPSSIDVRLGSSIIIPRQTFVGSHDITEKRHTQQVASKFYNTINLKYHSEFVLHPHQLVLAVTLEYISLPNDIFSQVTSRSSWGRLGLVVATASMVHPGYKGCLTLELVNLSDSPISLYPGLLVGQLVFMYVRAPESKPYESTKKSAPTYTGRYSNSTQAGMPKFFAKDIDEEMQFWGKPPNNKKILPSTNM